MEETVNQRRVRENPAPKGVWVVYAYDINAYPIAIFAEETEALRISNQFGYTHVKFWEFNRTWDDLHKRD